MAEIDWPSWSKTRPLTIEGLAQFSAIDLDPFTGLVACAICSQFKFSPRGDHNIGTTFAGLQRLDNHPFIGLGYTPRHIVNLLSKSDEGSNFLAICGALAEYYPTDTVAEVFMILAERANTPRDMSPSKSQWYKLVDSCAGVLSTSTFCTTLAITSRGCDGIISTDTGRIADGLHLLNSRTTKTMRPDMPCLSAMGEWLFDGSSHVEESMIGGLVLDDRKQANGQDVPTAGRVHWDVVFRTCFGQAWQDLNKETLAAVIGAASGMTHAYLTQAGRDPRTFFLRHEVGIRDMAGFGMNETIIAWFEELRRLGPSILRFYKAYPGLGQMPKCFDDALTSLEKDCQCSSCGPASSKVCLVSLAECIVALGLYVARMVVVPNLYMKVNGVQQFYRGVHGDRLAHRETNVGYSEWFLKALTEDLPTPFRMLEEACVLFTGSKPDNLPRNQLSLARSGLYLLITFLKFNPDEAPESRPAASVQIETGGFSYHGRFLQKNFWDPGPANISIEEGFDNVHKRMTEYVQIIKLKGQFTLISQVRKTPEEEKRAAEQGWDVPDFSMKEPSHK